MATRTRVTVCLSAACTLAGCAVQRWAVRAGNDARTDLTRAMGSERSALFDATGGTELVAYGERARELQQAASRCCACGRALRVEELPA